jgi:ankyrin repeat protein
MKRTLMLLTFFTLQPLVAMEPDGSKRPRIGQSDEFSDGSEQTTIAPRPPALPIARELLLRATSENLFKAAQKGDASLCDHLIDNGVNVDAQDSRGATALMIAIQYGHEEACTLLIKKGANVNAQDVNGKTVLMHAIVQGHKNICKLLLDQNADVNPRIINVFNQDGTIGSWVGGWVNANPLVWAAEEGQEEVCRLLIERGANIDARRGMLNDLTALMVAARNGHKKTCELLLKHNANVDAQNQYNCTALTFAACNGHAQICTLLLQHGANPNTLDDLQMPILINCIESEDSTDERIHKCVEILLKYGADVNLLSDGRPIDYGQYAQNAGSTALMEAISHKSRGLCELLLQRAADSEYVNMEGESALTRAHHVQPQEFEEVDNNPWVALLTNPEIRHAVMIRPDNPLFEGNLNGYYSKKDILSKPASRENSSDAESNSSQREEESKKEEKESHADAKNICYALLKRELGAK